MPEFHQWMIDESIISASFASEWFLTIFSAQSVEAAYRIWDVFLLLGKPFLFQVALTILAMKRKEMQASPEEAMEILKNCFASMDMDKLLARAVVANVKH
jgi:hypothetical protein